MPKQDNLSTTPIELNISTPLANLLERIDMDDEENREAMEDVLLRLERDLAKTALNHVYTPIENLMVSRLDGIDPRLGWSSRPYLSHFYDKIQLYNVEREPETLRRFSRYDCKESDDIYVHMAKVVAEEYDTIFEHVMDRLDKALSPVIPLFHRLDPIVVDLAAKTPAVQEYGMLRERLPAYCFDWEFIFRVDLSSEKPLRVGVVFQPMDVFSKEKRVVIGSFEASDLDNPLLPVGLASKLSHTFEEMLKEQVSNLSGMGIIV